MSRRPSPKRVVAVIALWTAVACGQSDSTDPTDAATPTPEPTASPSEAASPSPEPTPDDSEEPAEPEEPAEASEFGPLTGTWIGPPNEDGSLPSLTVQPNGYVSVLSEGFTCNGELDPVGGGSYVLMITQCIVPIPSMRVTLSEDGQTMYLDDEEEWRRE